MQTNDNAISSYVDKTLQLLEIHLAKNSLGVYYIKPRLWEMSSKISSSRLFESLQVGPFIFVTTISFMEGSRDLAACARISILVN